VVGQRRNSSRNGRKNDDAFARLLFEHSAEISQLKPIAAFSMLYPTILNLDFVVDRELSLATRSCRASELARRMPRRGRPNPSDRLDAFAGFAGWLREVESVFATFGLRLVQCSRLRSFSTSTSLLIENCHSLHAPAGPLSWPEGCHAVVSSSIARKYLN
jgi:hypothetical protein